MNFLKQMRLIALLLAAGIAAGCLLTSAWPVRYWASARVVLPGDEVVWLVHAGRDPQSAAQPLAAQLAAYVGRKGEILDPLVVRAQRPSLALNLALGGAAGLVLGLGAGFLRSRRLRPVRTERELVDALGQPLLAARPVRRESMRALCAQLLEHWFTPGRALLAVVGASPGEGRSRFTAQLAVAFAEMGCRTLVIDGDFRAPALHRVFDLPNEHGLADFLEDRRVSLASAGDNLAVMVAGSAIRDPLELLSRSRLSALVAEARRHFRVVLIDTPAAARGPDFQMFAAHAGGALVVTHRASADAAALAGLRADLARCASRLVTTVIHED